MIDDSRDRPYDGPVIDRRHIGRESEPVVLDVERGHIRRFVEAIGDANPIYFDEAAARAAGYPTIPAPPTFATALRPADAREGMGIDMRKLLHGEQVYEFRRPIHAGDRIRVTARVADIGEKTGKSGVMDVVTIEHIGADAASGEEVFTGRYIVLIRR